MGVGGGGVGVGVGVGSPILLSLKQVVVCGSEQAFSSQDYISRIHPTLHLSHPFKVPKLKKKKKTK